MFKIAIDGPSGSGKSTLAKRLSAELGFVYVDTGALYRAIGLFVYRAKIDPKDAVAVEAVLPEISVSIKYISGEQKTFLGNEDVSSDIRLPEISMYASAVSAIPAVRAFLLGLQRDIIRSNNVIMDGRDIGTVIMPDANVKIFLISNNETRAQRRCEELLLKGVQTTYEEVLADLEKRDANDSSRAVAPLTPAPDATFLDNSLFTPDQTFARALEIIRERIGV
ncbi:MAG: (d)CMP kinase [Clostridia bacterium]|nr:(d)CMP kinase [Clostridia bacterium]MBQ5601504.1 (d)CMP kinase [Clostridia bacterium]